MANGLVAIRRAVREEYPNLAIIGRGECRMGLLPTHGAPDFVAVSRNKPILIEVKNYYEPKPEHIHQAQWYNTMSNRGMLAVLEARQERPPVIDEDETMS
jgi:hypothetical protein